ncbi:MULTISPECIES: O-antigen ligase family protein [Bacillus]|uniref:O-antigen ligase family protein n=1 Tax=Bacillus TaxID=1386 RepID=UPI0005A33E94|nr:MULTISPECIES: O-antigen ligase family protein [Bacillus cereus group]AJG58220.1 O-Antigen ligase family protein [Bacillus cereus D17]MCU5056650.1 O-antigen ligase family protein [Bacillus cereus]QKI12425.1 O-antigen ligase family protein [Bacillus cereus]USL02342.1 O-antigen ligase family protein [Bacillus anthracis]SMD61578.1 O-Antigen ligase [Bacillus cereus]
MYGLKNKLIKKQLVIYSAIIIFLSVMCFTYFDILYILPVVLCMMFFMFFTLSISGTAIYKIRDLTKKVKKDYLLVIPFYIGCLSFRIRDVNAIEENPLDIASLIRVIMWMIPIIVCLLYIIKSNKLVLEGFKGIIFMMTIYALYALISSFYSVIPTLSFYRSVELLVVIIVVSYVINKIQNLDELKIFLNLNYLILTCLIFITWLIFPVYPNLVSFGFGDGGGTKFQLGGVFIHPNALGTIATIVFIISFFRTLRTKILSEKYMYVWMTLFSFITLFSTVSRTNLLIAVGVTIIALMVSKYYKILIMMFNLSVITILIIPFIREKLIDFFMRGQDLSLLFSLSERLPIWNAAIQVSQNKPILGHGFVSSRIIMPEAYRVAHFAPTSAHNSFLDVLVNLGYMGMILIIIVFFYMWILLLKNYKKLKCINIELLAIVFCVSIAAMTGVSFGGQIDHKFLITIIAIVVLHKANLLLKDYKLA